MSKVVGARIENEETWEKFHDFVRGKRGKIHTVLGEELQKALIFYMSDGKTVDLEELQNFDDDEGVPPQKKTASLPPSKKLAEKHGVSSVRSDGNADIGMFAKSFVEHFGSGRFSKEVVRKYMVRTQGYSSDKALDNRVKYMLGAGVLEYEDEPGFFRIVEKDNLGF